MVEENKDFRLSVSKTKTYLQCPKQYEFSYIQRLPKKSWAHHVFGRFCHMVLEQFHKTYLEGCFLPYHTVMGDAFKASWTKYKDKMTPEMKKECWVIIDQYLQLISKNKGAQFPNNVIGVEKKFEFPIAQNIILNGAIDIIKLDDDGIVHVADYKTTKNEKYLKDDFFQLLTYAYVITSEDTSIEKVRASYILLRHGFKYITKEFDLAEIKEVQNTYIKYAYRMNETIEFEARPSYLCQYCDFLEACEKGREKVAQFKPTLVYGEVSY